MKPTIKAAFFAVVIAAAILITPLLQFTQAQIPAGQAEKYKVISNSRTLEADLNLHASNGWKVRATTNSEVILFK